jgi:hypothetical protein
MRTNGRTPLACALALVLITANPLTMLALEIGHPDELLGGVLCVASVLLAACERPAWAGLALGAAIANKQWAVLALGPVLLALPARRILFLSVVGAVALTLLAPFALLGPGSVTANVKGVATPTGGVFQPWQIWWFLGHHGHVSASGANPLPPSDRIAPGWIATLSHPLIVAIAVPLTAAAWWRGRDRPMSSVVKTTATLGGRRQADALLLLSLLLLLRCMLDPWDNIYYPIPFILALLMWETFSYRRPALLAFTSTVAVWGGHHWLGVISSPDTQAAFFAAWSVPLAVGMAFSLYGRQHDQGEHRRVSVSTTAAPQLLDLGVQYP